MEEIESHHLFEGTNRVLLVDDVFSTKNAKLPMGPLWRYQYSNHLGSACLELRDDTAIISYEEFHPYGTSAYRAVNANLEASAKRYRYTGMERDEESGLSYHGARYLATWLGRWISRDPDVNKGLTAPYMYCSDNPVRSLDPNGKWEVDMHLLATYLAGRQVGASHQRALEVAVAAQHLDDTPQGDAVSLKTNSVMAGFGSSLSRQELARQGNNAHALGLSRSESGEVASRAIIPGRQSSLTVLFGLGLHTAEDFLPHANVSGKETMGHQEGLNEDLSPSKAPALGVADDLLKAADKTYKNPLKALSTFERTRELWLHFEGQQGPTKALDDKSLGLLSDFVFAESATQKEKAFASFAASLGVTAKETDELIALFRDKGARLEKYQQLIGDLSGKGQDTLAWDTWRKLKTARDTSTRSRTGKESIEEDLLNLPSMPIAPDFEARKKQNLTDHKQ